ncbi:MAG: hypothetical protein RLZZ450_7413 [Pseudomonadota bacterium]
MSKADRIVGVLRRWRIPLGLGAVALLSMPLWLPRCASYDLGCSEQPTARSQEICEALAEHTEISLAAKSIPLPGWHTELSALKAIYCDLGINANDAPELKRMSRRGPQALAFLALDLWELVTPSAPTFMSQRTNPQDPNYLLKDGCPGKSAR